MQDTIYIGAFKKETRIKRLKAIELKFRQHISSSSSSVLSSPHPLLILLLHKNYSVMDLDFQYSPPSFLLVSGPCMSISYSHFLQILFNLICPFFPLSFALPCSLHPGCHYFFLAFFCYLSFQYVHSIFK